MKYLAFKPSFVLKNRHIQTLYATFFRRQRAPKIELETFELSDGDFLECFWHDKPKKDDKTPIVILFHGLEGSHDSPYIKGVMQHLSKEGFASVLMHFRGCSGKENRLARSYHSGDTEDAKAWITKLSLEYPHSDFFGVGYSLGGNMLLKLMGEWQEKALLKATVAVSAPMQLNICADQMNRGFSKIYQAHLIQHLNSSLLKKYRSHPMQSLIGLNENEAKKLKTFWEFDEAYTAPIHGFSSARDYYERSSAKQYLKNIRKKTLIIHALDDPFMTPEVLPKDDEISDNIQLEISPHGGHVGFIGGSFLKPHYWLETRISHFLKECISNH
ncbi:MAG: hydrolase [Campylobacterota bacterium]|nr:hydrolase [Campylobacterota bacterium]